MCVESIDGIDIKDMDFANAVHHEAFLGKQKGISREDIADRIIQKFVDKFFAKHYAGMAKALKLDIVVPPVNEINSMRNENKREEFVRNFTKAYFDLYINK